jgi:hypothetical protein
VNRRDTTRALHDANRAVSVPRAMKPREIQAFKGGAAAHIYDA